MFSLISDDNQLASLRASADWIRLSPSGRVFRDPAYGSKSSCLIRAAVSVNSMSELAGKKTKQNRTKQKTKKWPFDFKKRLFKSGRNWGNVFSRRMRQKGN